METRAFNKRDIIRLFTNCTIPLALWDLETLTILDANFQMELLAGYPNSLVVGKEVAMFVGDWEADWWQETILKQLRLKGYSAPYNVTITTRAGKEIQVQAQSFILHDVGQMQACVLTAFKDEIVSAYSVLGRAMLEMEELSQKVTPQHPLSGAELNIARMIKAGKATKEIAANLFVTENTVNSHRKHIRKKLGITGKRSSMMAVLAGMDLA